MRDDLDPALLAFLQTTRDALCQDFLWVKVKDRQTGDPVPIGLWTGRENVDAPVTNVLDGVTVVRTFIGMGSMSHVSDIPLYADLRVRPITIKLSQIHNTTFEMIRGYDANLAPIEVYRGAFDPVSGLQQGAAASMFYGTINKARFNIARAGGEGNIQLRVVSASRELTKTNPETKSNSSQHKRDPNDDIYRYCGTEWAVQTGKNNAIPRRYRRK